MPMIVKDNAVSLAVAVLADEVSPVTRIRGTLAAPDGLCHRQHFCSLFSHTGKGLISRPLLVFLALIMAFSFRNR